MRTIKEIVNILQKKFNLHITVSTEKLVYSQKIPIFIKSNYNISCIIAENIKIIVLICKDNLPFSKKHISLINNAVDLPIVIVKNNINQSMSDYFIENKVSFISQNSIYLTHLLIYFKNLHQKPKVYQNKKLSKLAQKILISYLLDDEKDLTIRNCLDKFPTTSMSVSRALIELYENDILSVETIKRRKVYKLHHDIHLDKILENLKNPIVDTVYVKSSDLKYLNLKYRASFDALSSYTNITNQKPIFALSKSYFNEALSCYNIKVYDEIYDSEMVKIELFRYIPYTTKNLDTIDPFTLYITIKNCLDTEDLKVENAISELYGILEEIVFNIKGKT